MLYLIRSTQDPAGFCTCDPGIMDAPAHRQDLHPAGGTGWMFTCLRCRRGFDRAVAAQIAETLEELAEEGTPRVRRVLNGKTGEMREDLLIETPGQWMGLVKPLLEGLVEGDEYVFFDGAVLPCRRGPVRFKGLFREHDLPDLPHLATSTLSDILSSTEYWGGEPLASVITRIESQSGVPSKPESIGGRVRRWWLRRWS